MQGKDTFCQCHPAANFLYFALVLIFSMFLADPALLGISLICALLYGARLRGASAVGRGVLYVLPMMIFAAVINPLFTHRGVTVICHLPSGNPVTLESIVFGVVAALMIAAVIAWFSCCTQVLTTDKFVYIFGRILPVLSLVFSMTLRFFPRFKAQFKKVMQARKSLGLAHKNPIKNAVSAVSIMVTWSLENAVETADSMKGRGYGLPGRTAFSIYRLSRRDTGVLLWLGGCGIYVGIGAVLGKLGWTFYPIIRYGFGPYPVSLLAVYALMCLTPLILNAMEDRQWKKSISVI